MDSLSKWWHKEVTTDEFRGFTENQEKKNFGGKSTLNANNFNQQINLVQLKLFLGPFEVLRTTQLYCETP